MRAEPAILSIGMLATFALGLGGSWLLVRRGDRRHAVLMLVAALVLLANILLWAWPLPAHAASLPADVRAYAARRAACQHWRGEEPYDATRRAQIARAEHSACRHLDEERRRLRLRYRGSPRMLAELRLDPAR